MNEKGSWIPSKDTSFRIEDLVQGDEYEIEIFPRTIFNNAAEMVPVTVQLLKPVDEMKLELIEIRGNRVILEWTQVADVTGARPLDQASFHFQTAENFENVSVITPGPGYHQFEN